MRPAATFRPPSSKPPITVRMPSSPRPARQQPESPDSPGRFKALTDATEAMLVSDDPPYSVQEIRRALRTWAFSDRLRGVTEPPEDLAAAVRWLQTATIAVTDLNRPGIGAARCRAVLDRIGRKQDGTA